MVITKTSHDRGVLRETTSFEMLRRFVIALQLLLLIVLVIGRALSGVGAGQLSYRAALTPAALVMLARGALSRRDGAISCMRTI